MIMSNGDIFNLGGRCYGNQSGRFSWGVHQKAFIGSITYDYIGIIIVWSARNFMNSTLGVGVMWFHHSILDFSYIKIYVALIDNGIISVSFFNYLNGPVKPQKQIRKEEK